MSTSAIAPAREPDDQPRIDKCLKCIADGDAKSPPETTPVRSPTKQLPSSFDLVRIERPVGQLESRSKVLVKYRNAKRPQPKRPASNETGDISIFVALWLSSFALAVLYVLTLPHSANQYRVARKRVISTVPNPEEQKLTSPVGLLAKALASSSHGPKRLEGAGGLSKEDPQKTRGPAVPHKAF